MSLADSLMDGTLLGIEPIGVMLIPLAITVGMISLWRKWFVNRNRRSPLTDDLLRTPGYGLRTKIEDLDGDIYSHLTMIVMVPLLFYALYLNASQSNQKVSPLLIGVAGFIGYIYFLYKLINIGKTRRKYREALDGELATDQCLEPVIAAGAKVFHDIQADNFNIDHVVVAPAGVFAAETKHRLKPTNVNPKEMGKVRFDGQALHFPGWVETSPIEQARRQAVWLSKYLTKSTGEAVEVKPVLALPGWFVERTGRSDVIVVNPKNCSFMLKPLDGQIFAEDRRQRICYQLEQRCREPEEVKAKRSGQSS